MGGGCERSDVGFLNNTEQREHVSHSGANLLKLIKHIKQVSALYSTESVALNRHHLKNVLNVLTAVVLHTVPQYGPTGAEVVSGPSYNFRKLFWQFPGSSIKIWKKVTVTTRPLGARMPHSQWVLLG